jgi:hypothetical protein
MAFARCGGPALRLGDASHAVCQGNASSSPRQEDPVQRCRFKASTLLHRRGTISPGHHTGAAREEGAGVGGHPTVTRIPYRAVVDATSEASDGRRIRLRIEVADRAHGRPGGYELVCSARAAQTFVRALLVHRAALPVTGAIPPVTAERRTAVPLTATPAGNWGCACC